MPITCTGLLRMLRECKSLRFLLQIHSSLIVSGLKPHNQLVNAYSLFRRPDLSRVIFNSVRDPGVVLWNSMIRGYTRTGLYREALELFGYMSEEKGIDPDKYTFTFALKACTGSMELKEGLRIHDLISDMGFESDVYIGTALVEMYCKAGDLISARQVFDKMPEKDIVTWNIMVSGLAQNGSPNEALRLFRDMHLSCVDIDHVSLYNLIPAVSKLEDNDVCRCLHGFVIRKGFASVFSNGLIDMYCKCRILYAAECVFGEVKRKDDSSWSTMMAAYAHNGYFEEVLELFDLMTHYDVKMDKVAAASAIQAAAYVRDLEKGITIHEYVVQQGMMGDDVSVATSLMSMYSKCGELDKAEQVFVNIKVRDVVAWSSIIASFEQAGHHEKAFSLFRDMIRRIHVKPNGVTLTSVLPACAGVSASRLGKSIHCYAIKADMDSELATATAVISMYAKSGLFSSALKAFERLKSKDAVAFNALAQGYTLIGDTGKAFDVYNDMKLHGVCPDSGTMVGLLQTCALSSDYDKGCCVYGQIIKHGFDLECHVAHALIDMFTKCDALAAAKSLFDRCGFEKSTVSWNILMNGYLLHGQAEEAIATFRQMKVENFQPNVITFVNMLHAAAQLGELRVGMSVQSSLIRFGFCSYTAVGNSLVDMYAKCGMIESSERCFMEIKNKDNVSWNTMLSSYAVNGLASCAVSLFYCLYMQENELKPDSVSFLSVLSACRHAGLVEEGKRMFKEMEERAEVEHYACMVDLLGKAGLFDEAVEMVRKMRVKPSVGVWGALLSCSRMYCNLWLSNAALCQLVKLEPLNPSHYGQDLRLGDTDDGSRLKKVPACSWIQV